LFFIILGIESRSCKCSSTELYLQPAWFFFFFSLMLLTLRESFTRPLWLALSSLCRLGRLDLLPFSFILPRNWDYRPEPPSPIVLFLSTSGPISLPSRTLILKEGKWETQRRC
jgi:hypothetical protein